MHSGRHDHFVTPSMRIAAASVRAGARVMASPRNLALGDASSARLQPCPDRRFKPVLLGYCDARDHDDPSLVHKSRLLPKRSPSPGPRCFSFTLARDLTSPRASSRL